MNPNALTLGAARLLRSTVRLHMVEVFDWQCCLYGEESATRELHQRGLVTCRRDRETGRVWFRVTELGLQVGLTPETQSVSAAARPAAKARIGGVES